MAGEEDAKAKQTSGRSISVEKFLTEWALYVPIRCTNFYPLDHISFLCSGKCSKETTWNRAYHPTTPNNNTPDKSLKSVAYKCILCDKRILCDKQSMTVFYREMEHEDVDATLPDGSSTKRRVLSKVMKVGQFPAIPITVPKALEKALGNEGASLYRRGLANRNNGYGLGVVIYIRRIVEDKTNELIEVAAQLAESFGIEGSVVARLRAASSERTTYEQKIKIAATVLPESILAEGLNPLNVLYGLVSRGIHEMSEEECIGIADETREVFEYIFTNLRAVTDARKGFVQKVRKLVDPSN